MPIPNHYARWNAVAQAFHWLMAMLILSQFVLGWVAVTWHLSPTKLTLFVWHKSIGITVLALAIMRLVWRLSHPAPPLPAAMTTLERRLAGLSHWALYALMLAMPLSGWVISSASNVPFRVFWLVPLPALVAPDKAVQDAASWVHFGLFLTFAGLLVVHVTAALRHHFVLHDDVLIRMLPGTAERGARR